MRRLPINIRTAGIATGAYLALWCAASFIFDVGFIDAAGWAVFYLIGLCWAVFYVERAARRIEAKYRTLDHHTRPGVAIADENEVVRRTWNPLDPAARLYGAGPAVICFVAFGLMAIGGAIPRPPELQVDSFKSPVRLLIAVGQFLKPAAPFLLVASMASLAVAISQSRKLRHSLATLATYSLVFVLVYFLAHLRFGVDAEEDELPAGGGSDSVQASSVRVQKVIRKKYVVNPYSSILFAAPPPIDQIDPKLADETANRYKVGQGSGATGEGDGEGSGFGSGTGKGKATFVRLRHSDRGWDRNYGIDSDRNMLKEFGLRTKMKIAEETEYIEAATAPKRAPAMLYVSGTQSLPLTAAEKKSLREYVMDKHGMIVGDNHGGGGFHNNFIAAMNEITGTTYVQIPRDDYIHQKPYALPQLPIVVAHGGTTPLGWRVDGRWAVYYHPGALSDAWRDDRAGIRKEIAELCYQLGVNLMYYSMRERNKWNQSQKQ